MKKIILTLVLSIATLGFATFGQSTIGHVNTQKVIDTMASSKQAMEELLRFQKSAAQELQETSEKLQGDIDKFQRDGKSMSATAYKFEEERLMRRAQEFQNRQDELEQQMMIISDELNEPIFQMILNAVEIVSKKEKLDYVIEETSLLYSNGKDITDKVIVEVLRMEKEAAQAKE